MSHIDAVGEWNFRLNNLRIVIEYYGHLPDTETVTMYVSESYSGDYLTTRDPREAHIFPDYRTARLIACVIRAKDSKDRAIFIEKKWLGEDGYYWQMVSMRQTVHTLTGI